jgi:hypothetical protein
VVGSLRITAWAMARCKYPVPLVSDFCLNFNIMKSPFFVYITADDNTRITAGTSWGAKEEIL